MTREEFLAQVDVLVETSNGIVSYDFLMEAIESAMTKQSAGELRQAVLKQEAIGAGKEMQGQYKTVKAQDVLNLYMEHRQPNINFRQTTNAMAVALGKSMRAIQISLQKQGITAETHSAYMTEKR